MPRTMKQEYTILELAKKFNRSEQTIWYWVNTGKIQSTKDGFKHLIPVSELEAVEELCKKGRAKRSFSKRKSSNYTPAKRSEPTSGNGRIGRPASSTTVEVKVPAKLADLVNAVGGDLQSAVQKTVDEFCNTTIENLKNFN